MIQGKDKISVRQAILLFLTITYSPTIRVIPAYSSKYAQQSAWLTPLVSFVIFVVIVLMMNAIFKKYKSYSLIDIANDLFGRFIGKALTFMLLLWVVLLGAFYIRMFSVRLLVSIMPNTNINLISISILVIIVYVMHFGKLVTLARMNEIIIALITIVFFILAAFLLDHVELEKLTPVTYLDILGIIQGSLGITAIWAYIILVFLFGDKINNKEELKKDGLRSIVFLTFADIVLIVVTIGTFGYSIIERTQLPYLVAVKQISILNVLEKMESIVVSIWVASDFILIRIFFYTALYLIKALFNFQETKKLINIYGIFIFLLSIVIGNSVFELDKLSAKFFIPWNSSLLLIIVGMYIVMKIRKKPVG